MINLDAVGGSGRVRLEFNGDTPRNPSGTFLQTIAARISAQTGRPPARPSAVRQLVDLGFPFSLYEQAPFLTHGVAAVTLTTAGDNPPDPLTDTEAGLRADRLGQVGRAAQDALGTLDEGLEFTQGTSSYLYLGSRLIRGWAIELVLLACLLPFLAAAVDLFARCRRRRIPLGAGAPRHTEAGWDSGPGSSGCSSSSGCSARGPTVRAGRSRRTVRSRTTGPRSRCSPSAFSHSPAGSSLASA